MNVVQLSYVRFQRRSQSLRSELIRTFKNPLLRVSQQEFMKQKWELAHLLTASPTNDALRIKWELLREVENG